MSIAYADESVRMVGRPPFYMLGACIFEGDPGESLANLCELLPAGSRKLHWRDMAWRLQRDSLEVISSIESVDLVAVASPLVGTKQERARRKCLGALLPRLEELEVEVLVLESRGELSDVKDLAYVKHAKGSHLVNRIEVVHADGADEPRLWVADLLLGAMGDYETQMKNWKQWRDVWEALAPSVEVIGVPL